MAAVLTQEGNVVGVRPIFDSRDRSGPATIADLVRDDRAMVYVFGDPQPRPTMAMQQLLAGKPGDVRGRVSAFLDACREDRSLRKMAGEQGIDVDEWREALDGGDNDGD